MTRSALFASGVVAVALLAACSELPAAVEQDAERYVSLYEGWAHTAARHDGDCDAMGDALLAFAEQNAIELAAVEARLIALPDEQLAAFRERYDPRLEAVQTSIGALFRCLDHPTVRQAIDKI